MIMAKQDRIEYFKNEISRLSNQVVDLLDERDQLKAQVEQLNNLLVCMQSRACLFLQPDGEDDKDFINFVIGVLDGPEQRLAQSTPAQCLAEHDAEVAEKAYAHGFIDGYGQEECLLNPALKASTAANKYANKLRQSADGE